MGSTKAYLIFGTYHAETLHTAYLRLFNLELLIAIIEHGAHSSYHHCLAGSHVRGAAYYLHRFGRAQVTCGDMQMVGIRMLHTGEHTSYNDTAQAAAHTLHLYNRVTFQP